MYTFIGQIGRRNIPLGHHLFTSSNLPPPPPISHLIVMIKNNGPGKTGLKSPAEIS
uniref:Uncharacterized protein n=1 Tax=Tetranychus urticae TaxID=32264 RepID=T1KXH7_TETUR